jgi:hypothetical protein
MRLLSRASAIGVTCLTLAPASAREGRDAATRSAESPPASTSAGVESAANSAFRAELALRWAPIHHQDVNQQGRHALGGAADYLRGYDFDGDHDSRNNWENAADPRHSTAAHVYFAVAETRTHWFVSYLFFHPRDWSSTFFETEHENDAEGVLFAVERIGSRHGTLRAAITVAHRDFYSYVPAGSTWRSGREDIDGALSLRPLAGELHPVTAQEAEGHGLKAWPYYAIRGDGIVYRPSLEVAEAPSGPNDRHVLYRLRDVLEPGGLWDSRHDPRLFARFGTFAGNGSDGCGSGVLLCRADAAHTMWAWDDHDDENQRGSMASDPAALVAGYFDIPEPVAAVYSFNPFQKRPEPALLTSRREQGNGARY